MRGLVWITALAVGWIGLADVTAQDKTSGARPATTKTSSPKKNIQLVGGEESDAPNKQLRPSPLEHRVRNVPPELMKLLEEWAASSAKIKKLEGEHRRWEYDYVFNVVKHNTGKFYYEAPDKGRIDMTPDKDKVGVEETRKHWEDGRLMKFKGEAGPAERWYCDSQTVTQVNVKDKEATRMLLPKQIQGANIIDGPLPFLFGMPAQKAIQRYDLELKSNNAAKGLATIRATPLWPTDAANYQVAEIMLDTKTFLPKAVRLIDPAGTKETVFVFNELEKNSRSLLPTWIKGNPFKFEDRSFKITTKNMDDERADGFDGSNSKVVPAGGTRLPSTPPAGGTNKATAPANGPKSKLSTLAPGTVPSLIGLDHKKAQEILETLGYQVSLKKGSPANHDEQIFRVQRQEPDARSKLAEGETVTLWLFIKPKEQE